MSPAENLGNQLALRLKARVIQRRWRNSFSKQTTEVLVKALRGRGVESGVVSLMRFKNLMSMIREPETIKAMQRCIRRVHESCVYRNRGTKDRLEYEGNEEDRETINVRMLIFAYAIVYFRKDSLPPHETPHAQALYECGVRFLGDFEAICNSLEANAWDWGRVPMSLTEDFPCVVLDYVCKFKAFQVLDKVDKLRALKDSLLLMYNTQRAMLQDEDHPGLAQVAVYISTFRKKIVQIMGTALGLEELRLFDEERSIHGVA